jgi:hypothetical protein
MQTSMRTFTRHLQLVDENYRPRFVDATFTYERATGRFVVELEQFGEHLETRAGKAHAKRDLTLWFESIDGEKPRIPWAAIESGQTWHARVLMRDTFFEVLRVLGDD